MNNQILSKNKDHLINKNKNKNVLKGL